MLIWFAGLMLADDCTMIAVALSARLPFVGGCPVPPELTALHCPVNVQLFSGETRMIVGATESPVMKLQGLTSGQPLVTMAPPLALVPASCPVMVAPAPVWENPWHLVDGDWSAQVCVPDR